MFWFKMLTAMIAGGYGMARIFEWHKAIKALPKDTPKNDPARKEAGKRLNSGAILVAVAFLLVRSAVGSVGADEAKAPDAAKPQTEVVATKAPAPTKAPSYKDIEALVNVRPEVQAMQDSKGRYKVVVWVYNGSDKEIVRGTARLELIGSDGKVINDGWTDELHMLPLDGTKPRQRRYGVYWVERAINTMTYRVEVEVREVQDTK